MPHEALGDVKACVFDAYGTLFDVNSPLKRRAAEIGDKAERLGEMWRRKQLEYSWLRTLMGKYADFWTVTGESLDYAMATCDIGDPALRANLMQLYLEISPFPETVDAIKSVKAAGFKVAILSNGTPTMLTAAVNRAELTAEFDALISVDAIGTYKPHPTVYQLAVDKLGVTPHEIAFLSSNAWDVAGATTFGFRSVWCNRGAMPAENLPGKAVAEIRSLDELLPMLPKD